MFYLLSMITGVLATVIPGRICALRGDDLEYVPVSGWHVSVQLTLGALVALVTALALNWTRVNGAESVMVAVRMGEAISYPPSTCASCRKASAAHSPYFPADASLYTLSVITFAFAFVTTLTIPRELKIPMRRVAMSMMNTVNSASPNCFRPQVSALSSTSAELDPL